MAGAPWDSGISRADLEGLWTGAFTRALRELEGSSVAGFAFVSSTDLLAAAVMYRLAEDEPSDAAPEVAFSPGEWRHSSRARFDDLASALERLRDALPWVRPANLEDMERNEAAHREHVSFVYSTALAGARRAGVRAALPSAFITFHCWGGDDDFQAAERTFVEALNPSELVHGWEQHGW